MTYDLSCFKAYDIRGRVPDALNPDLARALGRAVADVLGARSVVLGRDARLSGPELRDALAQGLLAAGARVTDLGLCGTEEIYYAAANQPFDAGIMITGSHNPADENGFKLVRAGAVPVSGDSGLYELRERVARLLETQAPRNAPAPGALSNVRPACFRPDYLNWLLDYSGARDAADSGRPLKIAADAGNGCAGLVLRELAPSLPFDFACRQMEPDGHFPNGVPNPLLPEKRQATAEAVRRAGADLGIAWDGDFDRCFFYDSEGRFIEGYYLIGLLAGELLRRFPGGKVIHDTRVYWNTREMVLAAGGTPIMGKTGHAFMKERMRAEDAVYGGEMSAHHYFRISPTAIRACCPGCSSPRCLAAPAHPGRTGQRAYGRLSPQRRRNQSAGGRRAPADAKTPRPLCGCGPTRGPAWTASIWNSRTGANLRMSNTEPAAPERGKPRRRSPCWRIRPASCWPVDGRGGRHYPA